MKITTDSCLFGAIVAKEMSQTGSCKVLDIGAGTGLLSLMVAQQNTAAIIDAVEIDEMAAEQAKENCAASLYSKQITVVQDDIGSYKTPVLYDAIMSNPPFYEQQLRSPNKARELAHHSSELTLQQLFQQVKNFLSNEGQFFVLLPFYRVEEAIALAGKTGLSVEKKWLISQTPKHSFFRAVIYFKLGETGLNSVSEITIRNDTGSYTQAFAALLQPYYLKL